MARAIDKLEKTKTPGIFSRGSRYVVVYRDPQGRQRKRFARTLAEARDLKATLTADVRRGEFRALSRTSFAEYASEWLVTYQGRTSRGVGETTRDAYRDAIERLAVPFFGRFRLTEIEPRDVKRFAAQLEARGLAPSSVRKLVAPVKALLATAVEEGLLRANPAAGVRIARRSLDVVEAEQVKALTEDELSELLDKLPEEWRLFHEFLAQTGVRIGEAIEVRWSDVDLGGNWLHVRRNFYRGRLGLPKGGKTRRIRISTGVGQALWELRKQTRAGDDELVFTSDKGLRIDPSNLMSRVLKKAAVEAGLGTWVRAKRGHLRADTWVGFHTFRHSCATMLFRAGWNVAQVQRFLGHADPAITLRTYVHLLDEDLPDTGFLDDVTASKVGNAGATRPTENSRETVAVIEPQARISPEEPRTDEVAAAFS